MVKRVVIDKIPINIDPKLNRILNQMRDALLQINPSMVQPDSVTHLTATAKAGGVIVEFTRSDADRYVIYRNTTPSLNGSVLFDIGNSNRFVDDIGASGELRYYWVKGKKNQIEGIPYGPVSATTLALDAEITPATPPPGSATPAQSDEMNIIEAGRPTSGSYRKV